MKTAKRLLGAVLIALVICALMSLFFTDTPASVVLFWFGFSVCVVAVAALGIKWVSE